MRRTDQGFAVSGILYVLTIIGVGAAVLFSGQSQILRTNQEIARDQTVKADLRSAAQTLSAASVLINGGVNIQPPAALDFGSVPAGDLAKLPSGYAAVGSSGSPASVGVLTASSGARQLDPWNHFFLYCRWEGLTANPADPAILLISAGGDGVRDTNCSHSTAQNDDRIQYLTVAQVIDRASIWKLDNSGVPTAQFGVAAEAIQVTNAGDISAKSLTLTAGLAADSLTLGNALPLLQGGTGATTATGARSSLGSGTTGDSLFTAATAAGARSVLGSSTVGDAVFVASDAATARNALGAGVMGNSLFTVDTAANARLVLGSSTVGDAVFVASDAATARNVLGAGVMGNSLFTVDTAANARAFLGAGATGEAVFQAANQTAALTALGLIGGAADLDVGITGTAAVATSLADGANILAGSVPVNRGGTGAATAANARANLGTDDAGNITAGTLSWSRLPSSGAVAASYNWGTVNAYGIVEAASNVTISSLAAASAANSINNANYTQTWEWNTLGNANGLALSTTSTAAAGNGQTLLNLSVSGANATSTQTTYGAQIANTHTGTASTNVGLSVSASGGSSNYGLLVPAGNVGIGTSLPQSIVHISSSAPSILADSYGVGNNFTIAGRFARGTSASPAVPQSGDVLAAIGGRGYNSSSFTGASSAAILLKAGETWTTTANGSYITLETTATGSTTRTERMRINAAGNVGIATSGVANATLDIGGYMKLKINASAPVACSSTYEGSIAYTGTTTKYLCLCDGTAWVKAHDPATSCTW